MKKTERLLHILALLRQQGNLRPMDLAKRCEVSKRTILRDISNISSSIIPVTFDCGYQLMQEDLLPPMCFTSKEAKLLRGILEPHIRMDSGEESAALKSIMDKLETFLIFESHMRKKRTQVRAVAVESRERMAYEKVR